MNRIPAACCAAVFAALAGNAQAQLNYHVGIAGGTTLTNSSCIGATSCDRTGSGVRAWAGFTNKDGIGLEMVAHDFGSVRVGTSVGGTPIDAQASLRGVGIGAIYDHREGNWSFHGRLGIAHYRARVEVAGLAGSLDDTRNKPYLGFGLGYRFTPQLTAIAAVDWSEAQHRSANYTYQTRLLTLGLQLGF